MNYPFFSTRSIYICGFIIVLVAFCKNGSIKLLHSPIIIANAKSIKTGNIKILGKGLNSRVLFILS